MRKQNDRETRRQDLCLSISERNEMRRSFHIIIGVSLLLTLSCGRLSDSRNGGADSTYQTRLLTEQGQQLMNADNADSALVVLLNAVDYSRGCQDHMARYKLYALMSKYYERRNLTLQQQTFQQRMLEEAEQMGNEQLASEAYCRIATAEMVSGRLDQAATKARTALALASKDSLDYRAQALLLLCQIYLQKEHADSARYFLDSAVSVSPQAGKTDLFRLSNAYVLSIEGNDQRLEPLLRCYLPESSLYGRAELLRLLLAVHEEGGRWQDALDDSKQLTELSDSISALESAEATARIHALQHDHQMQLAEERQQAQLSAERAHYYLVVIIILLLLLVACLVGLFYRRRAVMAHARELEAMRLAEQVQSEADEMKTENIQLQKLYYEHLYAIILPILNARRKDSGHINLEEDSWRLIEQNTDMVLPGFTKRLRRLHPTLSKEDLRFCCLIMMRVPNAILSDIYGIAASSVAVRKQRMKKKFDNIMNEQTLEDYLNQYSI